MGKRYVEPALEMDTGFGASSLDEVQAFKFNVYCASSSAEMGASSRGAKACKAASSTSSSSSEVKIAFIIAQKKIM